MKEKTCLVCKHTGHLHAAVGRDAVYQHNGNQCFIDLCYHHSVEFFKTGQKKFIDKYQPTFLGLLNIEGPNEKSWFR
jgi:hypothetical protein